jgi:preprotein translocase subunit SecF
LLVVVSVYVLGSGPIKDFAFALIIGMIVGTYSSLFIAAPIFLWVNRRFYAGKGHLQWLANKDREGTGALLGVGTDREPGEVGPSGAIDVSAEPPPEAEAEGGGPDDGQRKVTRRRRRRRPD